MRITNPIRLSVQRIVSSLSAGSIAILAALLGLFPLTSTAQDSDLGVFLYPPPLDTFVSDWMPFSVAVTNFGPYTKSSVSVPCVLPTGVSFIDVSPASQSYTFANNTVTLTFSSLTNLETRSVGIRAKATNSSTFTFSASISATGNTDPNSTNNNASMNVNVRSYLSGQVIASTNSTQQFDPQIGLMEQWIQVSNSGPSPAASARVVVTGLTNELWNANGTNNGNPYVIYPSPLVSGGTGRLLLMFFSLSRTSFPFTNSQMQTYEVPMPPLLPPANLGTPVPSENMARYSSSGKLPGAVIIFFPSLTNRSYSLVYSDDPQFANPLFSPHTIVCDGANQTEWIDYGPPETVSYPTNTMTRYYRVYLNP